jgi:branched-chain amino acid transport system ATP-binding protein
MTLMPETPLLQVSNLCVSYGNIKAVKGVSLAVHPGEIVALIGANGAGKSTILRALAGLLAATGEVRFANTSFGRGDITRRIGKGLVLVPEGRGILGQMTVGENLLMGAYARRDRAVNQDMEAVFERFPLLKERRDLPATLLSGGEQQTLAIGRALLAKPRLLMLDEPSLGLSPIMVQKIFDIVRDLQRGGITILLVEQKARQTLKVADRAYLLETGLVVAEGPAAQLAEGSTVADAFLGGASHSIGSGQPASL